MTQPSAVTGTNIQPAIVKLGHIERCVILATVENWGQVFHEYKNAASADEGVGRCKPLLVVETPVRGRTGNRENRRRSSGNGLCVVHLLTPWSVNSCPWARMIEDA